MSTIVYEPSVDPMLRDRHKKHVALEESRKSKVIPNRETPESPKMPELGSAEYVKRLVGMKYKWRDVSHVAYDIEMMLDREFFTKRMTYEERAADIAYCRQILDSIRTMNEDDRMLYAVRLLDQMREKLKYITPSRKFHDLRHLSY